MTPLLVATGNVTQASSRKRTLEQAVQPVARFNSRTEFLSNAKARVQNKAAKHYHVADSFPELKRPKPGELKRHFELPVAASRAA